MKICFFTPIFPPKYSGATFQAITLAKTLRKKGVSLFFVAISDGPEKRSFFDGFEVYYVRVKNHEQFISGCVPDSEYFKAIARMFALLFKLRGEYSIIHSHIFAHPFTALSFIGKILRKKTIAKITMSNDLNFRNIGTIQGKLNKSLSSRFDKIVAISSEIANAARSAFNPRKVEFIPNGVDTQKFHPISREKKIQIKKQLGVPDEKIVTYVGGISKRKGIDSLIDIWSNIAEIFPNAKLLLVGPYTEEEGILGDELCYQEVVKRQAGRDSCDGIILTGRVENVVQYLQVSDVFVLPSKLEGMPNVLLEAMSCGVPVVCYRVSGVRDIVTSGVNGIIIEPGDKEGFTRAVMNYLKNPSELKKSGLEARASISKQFSIDRVADIYIQLYQNMI